VYLEKLSQEMSDFMKTERASPCAQESVVGPSPEPFRFSIAQSIKRLGYGLDQRWPT
jgi:hypothetical protein